jgi:hypothetical protein
MAGPDGTTAAPDAHPVGVPGEVAREPLAMVEAAGNLFVLREDGAVFRLAGEGQSWTELEPVPGTPRSVLWEQAGD